MKKGRVKPDNDNWISNGSTGRNKLNESAIYN
jgi:hypothetical protein